MKKDFIKNSYKGGIDSLFSTIANFNFESYLSNIYKEKVPNYFKKYLKPEKKYIDNLALDLNSYITNIQNNLHLKIKENPKKALKMNLEDLLFGSEKNKEKFCSKISESIEELSYASNILAAETYKIWNVKYNTPGIGNIAREKMKQFTGEDDLPKFNETKKKIEELKENTYSFLDYLGFNSNKRTNESEVKNQYQNKMKSYGAFTDSRRLLAYDLENGIKQPLNAHQEKEVFYQQVENEYNKSRESKLEKMTESEKNIDFERFKKRKEKQRKKESIRSNYNSWWEKLIGYVAYIFDF